MPLPAGVSRVRLFLRCRALVRLTMVARVGRAWRARERRALRVLGHDLCMPALPARVGHAAHAGQLRPAWLRVRIYAGHRIERVVRACTDWGACRLCMRIDACRL